MQTFEKYIDLKIFRKSLNLFSLLAFLWIPASAAFSSFSRADAPIFDTGKYDPPRFLLPEPLPIYEKVFEQNGLLGFSVAAPASNSPALKISIREAVKDYRLKGVIILDSPEALVADARTQKSVSLKAGDSLGPMTVKAIREGSVTLSMGNDEIELRME